MSTSHPAAGVKASSRHDRFRAGRLEARGAPAVLLGTAALVFASGAAAALIVVASGASVAVQKSATALPETFREAREFWLAVRARRRELPS
jgi:hypothetical protein